MLSSLAMNKTLKITRVAIMMLLTANFLQAQQESDFYNVPELEKLINTKEPILNLDSGKVLKLSIEECIKNALKYNYDIKIQAYNPAIRMDDVIIAEAAFDATLFGSAQIEHLDENNIDATYYRRYSDYNGNSSSEKIRTNAFDRYHNSQYTVGLRKVLSTGAVFQVAESLSKTNDLYRDSNTFYYTPFIEYGLEMQLQQPLLRDFGIDVNRASIRYERSRMNISKQEFQLQVINTMTEVESNYWYTFYFRQYVKILSQLVERAEKTLERVEARAAYDGKSLSVSRTQTVIDEAKADLLSARNSALRQQEALLESINNPEWPITSKCEIITVDNPQKRQYNTSFEQAVENALELRPELIAQRHGLDIANLVVGLAKNQVLPRADLFLSHTITGADYRDNKALQRQARNETYSWSVGLSMEYPLANRSGKASLSQAKKQKEQEELRLKAMQEQILYDVSNAIHEMNHKYGEINARLESVEAARNELLNYLAIQDTDRKDSTSPEFLNLKLNADNRLSRNQITAVRSMIEYDMAIMQMHIAQGVLDRYNNVEIEME